MRWSNTAIVVSVLAILAVLTIMGKLSGTDVIPMLTTVMTYSLGFHVVTVTATSRDETDKKE